MENPGTTLPVLAGALSLLNNADGRIGSLARAAGAVAITVALLFTVNSPAAAQEEVGSVQGQVVLEETNEPLTGAQISIVGTNRGTLTNESGRFLLVRVPAGTHDVRVQMIGYGSAEQTVEVPADGTANADFSLSQRAISLDELVVTGTAGETEQRKLAFEVGSVNQEMMPVPRVDAAQQLQGKISGVQVVSGSGRPGSAPSILLRGPTAINAEGRDQEPLFIVDGVILGSSMVDIDGLDIESIEVVKGAAAASMYGSRAANGVIQITTERGRGVAEDQVQYTVRTDWGRSDLAGEFELVSRHPYAMTEDGQFIDATTGEPCEYAECGGLQLAGQAAEGDETADSWNTFNTNQWPQTYNQVDRFFKQGDNSQISVSASGRSGATNFHSSYSFLEEEGVMPGFEGFQRHNFRVNVDQAVRPDVMVSGSMFYSRSEQDQFPEDSGNPLFALTRVEAGVDLTRCESDPNQSCLDNPDDLLLAVNPEVGNPLYEMLVREFKENRSRFLGSANLQYTPTNWLSLDAQGSYDRLDMQWEDYFPVGFRTISASAVNDGFLQKYDEIQDFFNASVTASLNFDLTDNISNRTRLRYLYEEENVEWNNAQGFEFAVTGVPQLGNLNSERLSASSAREPIRSEGYFLITNFDIFDRYVIDALVRNDGSSLFGEEERRHWYYRLAGAWLIAEEDWFDVDQVDDLKLRYSYGTAGGRPNWAAQYETYGVEGGRISPQTLGNADLEPEFSIEQEVGVDAAFLNGRLGFSATYANTVTENQILPVSQLAATGFNRQWQNAGTLESDTWELSLEGQLVQTQDVSWSARVLWDRTRSEITQLDVPPFTYGIPGQNLGAVYFAFEGEQLGNLYGTQFATDCGDLPEGVSCDGFVQDRNGWLVWVGEDGSLSDANWGEDSDVQVRGNPVKWGTPFQGECEDPRTGDRTTTCRAGNTLPDYHLSFSSTVNWRGLSLYGLLDALQGFDVYNQPLQWATFGSARTAGILDQHDVPEGERKPLGYFDELYNVSGLFPSNAFVEDGSYVKLREVSLRYRFGADMLQNVGVLDRFSAITLNLTGRNLVTWTDYRGYDPEVGKSGGDTGSSALARVEGFQYPNFRSWNLGLELNF